MSLQTMANQQTLQQQDIAANDLQVKQNAALNAAIQSSTTKNDDGSLKIDHDAVQKKMTAAGFGAAGEKWATAQKENDLKISQMTLDQQETAGKVQQQIAGTLSAVRSITDPAQRQAAWTQKRQQAIQTMGANPASIPEQVPNDDALGALEASALDAHARIQLRIQKQQADTAAANEKNNQVRADAADKRADAYQEKVLDSMDRDRYQFAGYSDKQGHPIILDRKTGKTMVNPDVTMDMSSTSKDRQVTPDAILADRRANQKDYENNSAAEIKARQDVQALTAAIGNGKVYVDPKGSVKPFSAMKQSDGTALSSDDIAAYQQEMKQRLDVAKSAIETAVANKNNAMQRNGVTPQVSTQDAINAYRGTKPAAKTGKGGTLQKTGNGTFVYTPAK